MLPSKIYHGKFQFGSKIDIFFKNILKLVCQFKMNKFALRGPDVFTCKTFWNPRNLFCTTVKSRAVACLGYYVAHQLMSDCLQRGNLTSIFCDILRKT